VDSSDVKSDTERVIFADEDSSGDENSGPIGHQ